MRHRKQNYQIGEWAVAETDSHLEGALQDQDEIEEADWHWNAELEETHRKFTEEANRVVTKWVKKNPQKAIDLIASDDYESEDDIAWNTWANIVGHGVGFWEHMDKDDYESLDKAIESDKKLNKAKWELENAMLGAVWSGMLEARVERYTQYLSGTLIPDLEESGKDATAEDFVTMVTFLEDDEVDEADEWTIQGFVDYLEKTLIPDLKESGAEYTAEDFERGIVLLRDQNRVKDTRYKNPGRKSNTGRRKNTGRKRNRGRKATNPAPVESTKKLKSKLLR